MCPSRSQPGTWVGLFMQGGEDDLGDVGQAAALGAGLLVRQIDAKVRRAVAAHGGRRETAVVFTPLRAKCSIAARPTGPLAPVTSTCSVMSATCS
jgi:hypothetical protein